ncbi:hypothetical protein L1987_04949 [Smallanthus sonchifolius]|uniref:Uncharacterized protein n=1 Tax=Smallanthus sonchifolius TaxID=185202 RepID=A0ACB9JTZ6_9ASTR|nr:hypothetical protein L1987_04949 [Smallanthus sonchifolius]
MTSLWSSGSFNDICVGSIACRLDKKEGGAVRVYIMTLGVLAPYRGLGTKLLNHVLDLSSRKNIGEIYDKLLQEIWLEDPVGKVGVALSKDLMGVAVGKKLFRMKIKLYIPDFKLAFEHFCIHAGGRAVLDEIEKNLQLTDWHMEPSRMTLNRFASMGNNTQVIAIDSVMCRPIAARYTSYHCPYCIQPYTDADEILSPITYLHILLTTTYHIPHNLR